MKFETKKKISLYLFACVAILCIILDLISKHLTANLSTQAIPGFFKIEYAQNTGAAWSIFSGSTLALAIISIFASLALVFYAVFAKTNSALFHVSLALIVGGALGNFYDRAIFGFVRDFIKLEFINFPTFNVADSFLTVGVACLCVYFLICAIKEFKNNKKEKKNATHRKK